MENQQNQETTQEISKNNSNQLGNNLDQKSYEQQIVTNQIENRNAGNSEKKGNDNIVFVGSKRLMNYVNSVLIQSKNSPEVIIKARGKFISKAVDIAEVTKRQTRESQLKTKEIKTGTEEYENEDKKIKVSTIEITLAK